MTREPVTSAAGLTINQWIVRESARAQLEADRLWNYLDHLMPEPEFNETLDAYNEVCDWMDMLEEVPVDLYQASLTLY